MPNPCTNVVVSTTPVSLMAGGATGSSEPQASERATSGVSSRLRRIGGGARVPSKTVYEVGRGGASEPAFVTRDPRRLHPVGRAELADRVGEVVAHRPLGQA